MDVEKNSTSSVDREENGSFSFGGSATQRLLEATILRLKLCYVGQVMRAEGSLERDNMLGQVAGHRKQGKPQMRLLDGIKEATGLRLEVLKEIVQDRKKWRTLVEEETRDRKCTNVK
jgi:hypothetical protein